MILIDKPYLSDFLYKTIKEYKLAIIDTQEAREIISDQSLNWLSETEAKKVHESSPSNRIYTNSENSIAWIEKNLNNSDLPQKIQLFKNKIKFRELMADSNPEYFFTAVQYNDLKKLDATNLKYPFIIKPAVGFFSLAVHQVNHVNEWQHTLEQIDQEIIQLKGQYPKEVIDITDFIIEEYIVGDEYAVDCYFNEESEPIILNILHHEFTSEKDVSDRVYSTSKQIILKYKTEITDFLRTIGLKADLKNFPAHVEVRIDKKGKVHPIEINPLRFGGWCTTGDLSWFAFGFNSYDYFLKNKTPNWDEIFKTREEKIYSIIVLDNNSGIKETDIDYFDYDLFMADFEKPLDLRKVDFRQYPVFGFLFTETSIGNEKELQQILTSNLRKYIKTN